MLQTTDEAEGETQPCSVEGRYWITADVRLDGRNALISDLRSAGQGASNDSTDPELILYAYREWGEQAVHHLIGDFAFAIWDRVNGTLFCARDHMGVKPFYYNLKSKCLVFSNTLNCVRAHPNVSSRLNDQAIGDFLLFGFNQDLSTTTFADIQALPRAHTLAVSASGARVARYWTLPYPSEIRYQKPADYVDGFTQIVQTAVADRVRSDRLTISLSGGLDSPTIANFALKTLSTRGRGGTLHGITIVRDKNDEHKYAEIAAAALRVPLERVVYSDYPAFSGWSGNEIPDQPEPADLPLLAADMEFYDKACSHGRILLTGSDGDSLLAQSRNAYVSHLLKAGAYAQLVRDSWEFVRTQRRLPTFPRFSRGKSNQNADDGFPAWLESGFAQRVGLRERWESLNHPVTPSGYELRDSAYHFLTTTNWNIKFVGGDPGVTRRLLESRHPLIDIRVIEFCLSLPQVPWCLNKYIMRAAMKGQLPEIIRTRPKTTVTPWNWISSSDHRFISQRFTADTRIREFVEVEAVPLVDPRGNPETHWSHLRPLALSHWLGSAGLDA
jgi:asparagine synthase (glutamine-hydrolysing)